MSPRSKTSKTVLLLIAFSLTIGAVAAQETSPDVTIDDGDKIIWEQSPDQKVNADVTCGDSIESVYIQREYYEPFEAEKDGSGEYGYDMSDRDPGFYNMTAECSSGETASDTFVVDELDFDVEGVREGDAWFVGFDESVNLQFSSEARSFENEDLGRLEVFLGGENIRTKNDNFGSDNEFRIDIDGEKFEDKLLEGQDTGDKYLVFDVIYDRAGDDDYFNIKVNRTIELNKWKVDNLNVNPDDSVTRAQFNRLNLVADIYYQGDPVNRVVEDFGADNFKLEDKGSEDESGSRWFDGELVDPDRGRYSISLGPTPQDLSESENVVFDATIGGVESIVDVAEINIENIEKFLWNTKVLTPSQDAVEADFRVNYADSYVNFTSTNGDFSEKIYPGENDLEVTFPTSRLSLSDVDLNEENSGRNILYNYLYYSDINEVQSADKLEGIKPVNLASYNFAYPLSGGSLEMRFNNEQIDSAEAVKVFECTEWHFGDKECRSTQGWDEVDDVTTVPASWKSTKYSTAEFNIDTHDWENEGEILQNAYIVGTSADLVLNGVPSIEGAGREGRVESGGEITVSQTLSSENDNPVSGAEVIVSFYEGEDEIKTLETVETDSEGSFSVTGDAPLDPGNYSIAIEAEADNFNDLETRYEEDPLEVFVAEGVSIDAESTLEVTLGQETSTIVDVDNTGQTEMQDVQLSFSGLNSDFYSSSRSNLGDIEAGESATAEVTFDIPESYGVEDYPELQIDVTAQNGDGEEFEDSEEILAQLTYGSDTSSSEESETSDTEEEGSSFSPDDAAEITGEFLDSQSSLNIALGLILVFMMALVGAVKKKKQEDDNRRRNGRPAAGR